MRPRLYLAVMLTIVIIAVDAPAHASGADLQPATTAAYSTYVRAALQAFEDRVRRSDPPDPARDGVLSAGPAHDDGIIQVPGGLIHHWKSTAFARRTSLACVLEVSTDYSHLRSMYQDVLASTLLAHDGDTYKVRTRLKEQGGGLSAVLDITSTIDYRRPSNDSLFVLSHDDDIHQVLNAGRPNESLLPTGHDSGYLWRANDFTYFTETHNGVYVVTETIGLSRRYPPMLAWVIRPVARRLGRKSVETGMTEFLAAVQRRCPSR